MFKKDSFLLGTLYGTIIPIVSFGIAKWVKELVGYMFSDSLLYILCIGVNAIFFRFAIKQEKDNLAKGMLLVTFVYAFIYFFVFYDG